MSDMAPPLLEAAAPGKAAATSYGKWRALVWVVVLLGIIFRMGQYLSDRSYWHDEAFLVLNIFEKDAGQLMGPLDVRKQAPQAAPPLFLLVQRGMYDWLGGSEFVMRLIPLTLGMGAMFLMAWLAWRRLGPPAAVFSTALFAFSDRIIWHASEAKQYSGDIFFAAVLLWLALGDGRRMQSATRRLWMCSIVTAAGMWMSHPMVFVFGGISLALLPEFWRGRRIFRWIAANAPAVASFGALYWLSIRVQENSVLKDYWAGRFVDWSRPLGWPVWFVGELGKLFDYPYTNWGWLLIILCIAGSIGLWRKGRKWEIVLLFSPIALVLAGACLHTYPFGGHRLTVFLAPAIFLGAGYGIDALIDDLTKHRRIAVAGLGLSAAAAAYGLGLGMYHLAAPRTRDHLRPAVAYVRAHYQQGDGIIALDPEEFLCYWRPPPQPWMTGDEGLKEIPGAWKRFWIIGDRTDRDDRARWAPWMKELQTDGAAQGAQAYQTKRAAALLFRRPER